MIRNQLLGLLLVGAIFPGCISVHTEKRVMTDDPETNARKLVESGKYHEAMRELPSDMDNWNEYTERTGNKMEGAAGFHYIHTLDLVVNQGDAEWGKILDDPDIPYNYKTSMIFEILEQRLGKGAVYVGNNENYIVPRNKRIDFNTEERIHLPE